MDGKVGAKDKWKPTWWGKSQLTHLPGVRQYLIDSKISAERETMDLNQLAEFGPQNLEDAWAYFKTWVKGMPISEAVNFNHATTRDFDRSNFGPKMPSEMMRNDPLLDSEPTATDTQWRYEWPGAKTSVKTEQKFEVPNANFDATPTPKRDAYASAPPAEGNSFEASKEDNFYNRTRTTRTSQYVDGGKARHMKGEFVRGVGANLDDREQARVKGFDPRPSSPGSGVRPTSRQYTAQNRPPSNEEEVSDYVEFVPGFRPGGSVPQDYAFNTPPPAQPPPYIDGMDKSKAHTRFYGDNPNMVPPIYRNAPIFSPGYKAEDVKLDTRGLEKRQVEALNVLYPYRRMASDRQANPIFKWSAFEFKGRRASNFREQRDLPWVNNKQTEPYNEDMDW